MSLTNQSTELQALALQGAEHLDSLRELLARPEPPELAVVRNAISATRALRGSASLLGFDDFQSFLGRLFGVLEDVESSELPWSAQLELLLQEAEGVESMYLGAIAAGESSPDADPLLRIEASLVSWRREAARRFEEPTPDAEPQHDASQSDASESVGHLIESLLFQVRDLGAELQSRESAAAVLSGLEELGRELEALRLAAQATAQASPAAGAELESGLRNHCEGALRQLVEAAAQEVLDEARERGLCLGLRATGSLGDVDDELGGALLEILRNLWSDSLRVQAGRDAAQIDTVLRLDDDRLVIDVRDPESGQTQEWDAEDVSGRYPGLRRLRPLVEALQGLVWVESERAPGCRFRLSLPRTSALTVAQVVRVGTHEIALPPSAIEGVFPFADVRVHQDAAGPVVQVGEVRYPPLHLAFALQDPSYDDLRRELVVVLGSFERRAALFASGPCRTLQGVLHPGSKSPWLGTLEAGAEKLPVLDLSTLVGREGRRDGARAQSTRTILVVTSPEAERTAIVGIVRGPETRALAQQSAEAAWEVMEREPVDLLICDLRLPEMNAQRIAELRRQTGRHTAIPVLLVLAHAGEQSHLVVQQLGAADFVRAPVQGEELAAIVQRLMEGS